MKRWLRADGVVEFVANDGWYWKSGHWRQTREVRSRSVMRELVGDDPMFNLEYQPGYWLLPGTPP